MIRAIIIEDEANLLNDVLALLSRSNSVTIAATYRSAKDAIAKASKQGFDAALVDLNLGDGSGIDVIHRLRETHPDAGLVAFTKFDDDDSVFGAIQAGASGYVLKTDPAARIEQVLLEAAAGGAPMTPRIARRVLASLHRPASPTHITDRERDVLEGLVEGLRYAEIAEKQGVALSTVQTHIKNLYRKLHVSGKASATRVALAEGLVKPK